MSGQSQQDDDDKFFKNIDKLVRGDDKEKDQAAKDLRDES